MAFIFRENRRHGTDGQTDGRGATLNAAAIDGCIQHVMPAAEAGTGITGAVMRLLFIRKSRRRDDDGPFLLQRDNSTPSYYRCANVTLLDTA